MTTSKVRMPPKRDNKPERWRRRSGATDSQLAIGIVVFLGSSAAAVVWPLMRSPGQLIAFFAVGVVAAIAVVIGIRRQTTSTPRRHRTGGPQT